MKLIDIYDRIKNDTIYINHLFLNALRSLKNRGRRATAAIKHSPQNR